MKKIRKITTLLLTFIFTLSTVMSVYAWVVLNEATEALDLYARTSELFDASLAVGLTQANNQLIDYNHTSFNRDDLAVTLNKTQMNHVNFSIKVSVNITARQNIKVRFKVVEMWMNSSGNVIANPNAFDTIYDANLEEDLSEVGVNYVYGDAIYKETSVTVDVVTSLKKKVGFTFPAAVDHVRLVVLVSAVQLNRSDIWDDQLPVTNTLTTTGNNNYGMNVVFNNVANDAYLRGLAIEFIGTTNSYVYLWHTRNFPAARTVNLPAGTYTVKINLVNHLIFAQPTISNGKVNITISYGPELGENDWGYEDFLYSPSVISYWSSTVTYVSGNIVYFQDLPDGTNAGFYVARQGSTNQVPDAATWAWSPISPYYQSGRLYLEGTIVFYNGAFYLAKTDNTVLPTTGWAWERLDKMFNIGNTYATGDVTYYISGGITKWYYAYGNVGSGQSEPKAYQDFRELGINYSAFNKNKYLINEYVLHNGNYYTNVTTGTYEDPSLNSQVWRQLGFNYTSVQSYPQNHIILYNGNYYIALANISAYAGVPGSNANWRIINNSGNYSALTTYSRYQRITYNGNIYFWNQAGTTINTNPETTQGWWLIGSAWHYKNTYIKDSLVLHQGEYYALRTGTSTNQEPGVAGEWQRLSQQWNPTNMYYNASFLRSMVEYDGRLFMWQGTNGVINTQTPGTIGSNWQELTEIWRSYNTYKVGDKVIYDGSFWEALQVPVDSFGNPVVPSTDFTVWKEYQIIWDPNRS